MRILVIGATGTLGSAVVESLGERHDIIRAGRNSGDIPVDMEDPQSLLAMYKKVSLVDAVVVTAGRVHFGPLESMTEELYQVGIRSKLLGQVNTVLQGLPFLTQGGSFTLTSGSANRDPYSQGSATALVNGAIDGFVRATAIELFSRSLRINAVSPSILTESLKSFASFFPGFKAVPASEAALAYSKSVEGGQTGQVYQVGDLFC